MQPACREQLAWEKPAYSRQNYRAPPPRQSAGLPKRHQTHASIQTISQRANRPSGPSPGTQRGKASRSVPTVPAAPAQARSEAKPPAACQPSQRPQPRHAARQSLAQRAHRPNGPSPGTQRGEASRSVPTSQRPQPGHAARQSLAQRAKRVAPPGRQSAQTGRQFRRGRTSSAARKAAGRAEARQARRGQGWPAGR